MNGRWLSKPDTETCLVFIHGILSDSRKCWTHANGTHWPTLAAEDAELRNIGVYEFTYKTRVFSGDYGISDAVDSLKENFRLDGLFEFNNVIFVCHSMGGIIARKFLIDAEAEIENSHLGLFMLGSPSLGSKKASIINLASKLIGNKQAQGLVYIDANPWLRDLHKGFNSFRERRRKKIVGKELIEDTATGFFGKIVEEHSAGLYFGDSYKVPDTDHSTLTKLDSLTAIQHRILKRFALEKFERRFTGITLQGCLEQPALPDPLFEIYDARHEAYYVQRDVDSTLVNQIKTRSVWLHGPSGCGKTSVARRYLRFSHQHSVEISLSIPSDTGGVLREIAESLAIKTGRGAPKSATSREIIEMLVALNQQLTIILFLDEVPVNASSGAHVVDVVAGLHDSIRRQGHDQIRFIACSLAEPSSPNNQRLFEQFTLVENKLWSHEDLAALIILITLDKEGIALSDEQVKELILAANGSPRFVKTFFRELKNFPKSENPFTEGLSRARMILR
ncbi:AAA family ATPase [Acidovorax sp. sif1233]|uniref:AAA family ATPase n=1 Tax=Acidovorax sp. sif1233 TaxID=2854792 RepID=UPI001C47BB01|nr:AAA family ATPase [Acidovorax sp. sif1233]MBV7454931.1 AAA family ATPase [Acidovorax sp. sif1233]